MTPLRAAALLGFVLAVALALRDGSLLPLLTAFGPGVAAPLGFEVALEDAPRARRARIDVVVAIAAGLASLGFFAERGSTVAIASVLPYALACVACAVIALARAHRRIAARFGPVAEVAVDVALLFLPAAAAWLLAARAGRPLLGFGEPVVTFTAVHFHVAGFAAPMILGGAGRRLANARGTPARYPYAVAVVCSGVPLTAIGIATSHAVESVSAVVLAGGMLLAASVLVGPAARAARARSRVVAALFVVSGATLLVSMALATTFALTASAGRGGSLAGLVPLSAMIAFHGGANALGFALPGLVALVLTAPMSTCGLDVPSGWSVVAHADVDSPCPTGFTAQDVVENPVAPPAACTCTATAATTCTGKWTLYTDFNCKTAQDTFPADTCTATNNNTVRSYKWVPDALATSCTTAPAAGAGTLLGQATLCCKSP